MISVVAASVSQVIDAKDVLMQANDTKLAKNEVIIFQGDHQERAARERTIYFTFRLVDVGLFIYSYKSWGFQMIEMMDMRIRVPKH